MLIGLISGQKANIRSSIPLTAVYQCKNDVSSNESFCGNTTQRRSTKGRQALLCLKSVLFSEANEKLPVGTKANRIKQHRSENMADTLALAHMCVCLCALETGDTTQTACVTFLMAMGRLWCLFKHCLRWSVSDPPTAHTHTHTHKSSTQSSTLILVWKDASLSHDRHTIVKVKQMRRNAEEMIRFGTSSM